MFCLLTPPVALAAACAEPSMSHPPRDSGLLMDAAVALDASVPRPRCRRPASAGPAVEVVVDRQARDAILNLIDSAQSCLDVFEFELLRSGSAGDVQNRILEAAQRGVHVRVLLDDEVDSNEATARNFRALGINARVDRHSIRTHLKVIAADGATILIGSTNLSGASIDRNHESNILLRDVRAVNFLTDYLDALWLDPGLKPATRTATFTGPVRPWVDGGYAMLAMPMIDTTSVGIDMISYAINLDPRYPNGAVAKLANALFDAVSRGLTVRVLLEQSDWNDTLNAINFQAADALRAGGVFVRFDDRRTVTHAKLLITNGQVMVGTNNWSYSGLVLDHEAGVLITIPETVSEFQTYFNTQWRAAE
jgi:phosphatidylserine/phosphatidylglycerophosphate/cardiolipin synthase-like enzyme